MMFLLLIDYPSFVTDTLDLEIESEGLIEIYIQEKKEYEIVMKEGKVNVSLDVREMNGDFFFKVRQVNDNYEKEVVKKVRKGYLKKDYFREIVLPNNSVKVYDDGSFERKVSGVWLIGVSCLILLSLSFWG